MQMKFMAPVLAGALLGLAGCGEPAPTASAPVAEESPFRLTATIQDIMHSMVDPQADFLWAAVGSTITASGEEANHPQTDEQWELARRSAITLIEATNLLVMPGRRVVAEGKEIEDADLEGVLTPQAIEAKIAENRAAFIEYARVLHDAGVESLRAIEAKDIDALTLAGEKLDMACEACHRPYWYPNTQEPVNSRGESLPPGQ